MVRHIAKQTEAQFRSFVSASKNVDANPKVSTQVSQIGARLELMFSQLSPVASYPIDISTQQRVIIGQTQFSEVGEVAPALPLPTAVFQTDAPSDVNISLAPSIPPTFATPQSSGVVLRVEGASQKPPIYFDFLLEEQRKAFGNSDVIVAETLYQRALSRITQDRAIRRALSEANEPGSKVIVQIVDAANLNSTTDAILPKPDWVANENDLREAMAILADKSDDMQLQRLETAALLSMVLRAQNKNSQAAEFSSIAADLIQRLSAQPMSDGDLQRIKLAQQHLSEQIAIEP
jgi:hypothetical protein